MLDNVRLDADALLGEAGKALAPIEAAIDRAAVAVGWILAQLALNQATHPGMLAAAYSDGTGHDE